MTCGSTTSIQRSVHWSSTCSSYTLDTQIQKINSVQSVWITCLEPEVDILLYVNTISFFQMPLLSFVSHLNASYKFVLFIGLISHPN